MRTTLKACPRDCALVISLGGEWSSSIDWQLYYCPKCDTPVSVIASGLDPVRVTCWVRVNGNAFEPQIDGTLPVDHAKVIDRLRARIPSRVAGWLRTRHAEPSMCQMDGSTIQQLASMIHAGQHRAIYLWCPWCKLGFAFLNDPEYGWECHLSFARRPAGYDVFQEYPTGGQVVYRREWLQELVVQPPDRG